MPKFEIFKQFLSQASAKVLRSSVIGPLAWMTVILISAILLAFFFKIPLFIVIIFIIFFCLVMTIFVFAYMYFMFKNPDYLRSEFYFIQKLAIEKGLVGDNLKGLLEIDEKDTQQLAVSADEQNIE